MVNKNENREVAIRLTNVKKMYKLGQIGGGTLQGDLQSWWARIRGKEDPNSKIIDASFVLVPGSDPEYPYSISKRHSNGCNILWVDGHVSYANKDERKAIFDDRKNNALTFWQWDK